MDDAPEPADSHDLAARVEAAERAAREGGALALDAFRSALVVEEKASPVDLVTDVDREVQRHVVDVLGETHPDEPVVGEEAGAPNAVPEEGPAWIVDPIDGTTNYVAGNRTWGTCVAAIRDGEPVAGVTVFPALEDTYRSSHGGTVRNGESVSVSGKSAVETFVASPLFGLEERYQAAFAATASDIVTHLGDIRRVGSAQATLSMVASGEIDAGISSARLWPWDTVAGVHLVRGAGGTVTDLEGEPWRHDSPGMVASNGAAHDELLDLFGEP